MSKLQKTRIKPLSKKTLPRSAFKGMSKGGTLLGQSKKAIYAAHSDSRILGIKGVLLHNAVSDMRDKSHPRKLRSILINIKKYGKLGAAAKSNKAPVDEGALLAKIRKDLAKLAKKLTDKTSKEYRLVRMYTGYLSASADGYPRIPKQKSLTAAKDDPAAKTTEFQLIMLNNENSSAFRPYVAAEYFGDLPKDTGYGVGLLTEDGRAAGAIACTREGDALVINSVFVDETVRDRGAGTLLIDETKALSQKLGTVLCARCAYPSQREIEAFFVKNGFRGPVAGNSLFSVPFKAIRQSNFMQRDFSDANSPFPFHEAPREAVFEYISRIGNEIPAFVSLEHAWGKPIPEATLVCFHDGSICAFIICTALDDGSVYLNSLYAEKAHSQSINVLVQAAMRALCEKSGKGDVLHVAAHNEDGLKIIRQLLRGVHGEASENITHTAVFYPESESGAE
jgi:GNAT superfamily N-acetyltransferase